MHKDVHPYLEQAIEANTTLETIHYLSVFLTFFGYAHLLYDDKDMKIKQEG